MKDSLSRTTKRDRILDYIEGVLLKGYTKQDAYLAFIDEKAKNPRQSMAAMERTKEFQDLHATIMSDDNMIIASRITRIQGKFTSLVEKNIDTMGSMLDDVAKGNRKDRAATVRLANETISAMAVISNSGVTPANEPRKKIDAGGIIS